jgi:hypothetical protein
MKHLLLIVLSFFYFDAIQGQDLLEKIKRRTFTKNQIITSNDSPLAQKFLETNIEELEIVSLFNFNTIESEKSSEIEKAVSNAIVLEFNNKKLKMFLANENRKSQFLLRVPVDHTNSFDLLLEETVALSKDFILETSEGEQIEYEAPGSFYNGIIDGIPESFATVSFSEDGVEIIASDVLGNYVMTKLEGTESEYILYNENNLQNKREFNCGLNTEDFAIPGNAFQNMPTNGLKLKVRDNVEVFVEVDYDLYADAGFSISQTMDFVLDLFRGAVSVFEKEFISLRLNRVLIWTANFDPFNNITNFDDLGVALDNWACIGLVGADIGHYIGATGGIGGLANGVGGFCDLVDSGSPCGTDPETSHCVSLGMDTPYFEPFTPSSLGFTVPSWELNVFCHEMGHVFGSPHTQDCVWNGNNTQIDDCGNIWAANGNSGTTPCFDPNNPIIPQNGGSMMSFCHLTNTSINLSLGFGVQPSNLIRNAIYTSSCIGSYTTACPEIETLEETYTSNETFDARREIIIYDGFILSGFTPTFTGGENTIIHGDFACPTGAGFLITLDGCN